jgi:hypothetical protein
MLEIERIIVENTQMLNMEKILIGRESLKTKYIYPIYKNAVK